MQLDLWNQSKIIREVNQLIYEKLANIQQALKVGKNQRNNFGGYNFRNCSDILEAVKPLLKQNKCTILLSDEVREMGGDNYVVATAMLIDLENDNKSIANTAWAREPESLKGQTPAQITGGSSSYARKYALNGLFAIDDSTDDPDNLEQPKTTTRKRRSRVKVDETCPF